jgi:hypothetical protein
MRREFEKPMLMMSLMWPLTWLLCFHCGASKVCFYFIRLHQLLLFNLLFFSLAIFSDPEEDKTGLTKSSMDLVRMNQSHSFQRDPHVYQHTHPLKTEASSHPCDISSYQSCFSLCNPSSFHSFCKFSFCLAVPKCCSIIRRDAYGRVGVWKKQRPRGKQ